MVFVPHNHRDWLMCSPYENSEKSTLTRKKKRVAQSCSVSLLNVIECKSTQCVKAFIAATDCFTLVELSFDKYQASACECTLGCMLLFTERSRRYERQPQMDLNGLVRLSDCGREESRANFVCDSDGSLRNNNACFHPDTSKVAFSREHSNMRTDGEVKK